MKILNRRAALLGLLISINGVVSVCAAQESVVKKSTISQQVKAHVCAVKDAVWGAGRFSEHWIRRLLLVGSSCGAVLCLAACGGTQVPEQELRQRKEFEPVRQWHSQLNDSERQALQQRLLSDWARANEQRDQEIQSRPYRDPLRVEVDFWRAFDANNYNNMRECVRNRGFDIDTFCVRADTSALGLAACVGDIDKVGFLLREGASIDFRQYYMDQGRRRVGKDTPLMLVMRNRDDCSDEVRRNMIQFLIENGADCGPGSDAMRLAEGRLHGDGTKEFIDNVVERLAAR